MAEKKQDYCNDRIDRMWCVHLVAFLSHTNLIALDDRPSQKILQVTVSMAQIFFVILVTHLRF
ncbi:MAG: hypothetical protein ACR2IV_07905 [Bryobacteraceae bacterium]